MTDQATRVVTAGWYQDPAQPGQVRWWNGLAWTEHFREKPNGSDALSAVGPGATDAPLSLTSGPSARELEGSPSPATGANRIITSPARSGAGSSTATHEAHSTSRRTATLSSWLIAMSPLLLLVLEVFAAYVFFYLWPTVLVFAIAFAVPYILCFLWARSDHKSLVGHGFEAPSPLWALATALVYLIVRRIRVGRTGPIAMFLTVGVLVLGLPPLLGISGQLTPLSAALRIQQTISTDYISHGKAVQVNCPPFVDATTPGTLYTCDVTQATGVHKTLWVSIDRLNKFSYSFSLQG